MRYRSVLVLFAVLALLSACGGSPPDFGLPPADVSPEQAGGTAGNAAPSSPAPSNATAPSSEPAAEASSNATVPVLPETVSLPAETGTLVFGVTDAALGLSDISAIKLTIGGAQAHHAAADEWVQLIEKPVDFDLLRLNAKDATEILGEIDAPVGTYDVLRLIVREVQITSGGASPSTKMPSKTLTFPVSIAVDEDATSVAVFDFLADKSVHKTVEGRIIFAPVVKVETRKGVGLNKLGTQLVISGGTAVASAEIGMDADGGMGADKRIEPSASLSWDVTRNKLKYTTASATTTESTLHSGSSPTGAATPGSQFANETQEEWIPCNLRGLTKESEKKACMAEQIARSGTTASQRTLDSYGASANPCDDCCDPVYQYCDGYLGRKKGICPESCRVNS